MMPRERHDLRIQLRIKPVGLQHRRLEIVDHDRPRHATEVTKRTLDRSDERLGILPQHRLRVALARVTQHHAQHMCATLSTLDRDRRSAPEVHLHLGAGLALHASERIRRRASPRRDEPTHRVAAEVDAVLIAQVGVDAHGGETALEHRLDQRPMRPATAGAPRRNDRCRGLIRRGLRRARRIGISHILARCIGRRPLHPQPLPPRPSSVQVSAEPFRGTVGIGTSARNADGHLARSGRIRTPRRLRHP